MKIEFHTLATRNLKFVVIQGRYQDKWIFVRHKERDTWECPGGHIEHEEDPDNAAKRELKEETGATDFEIEAICDYSVDNEGTITYGRLYLAEVYGLGNLEHEIEEIRLLNDIPSVLTYGQIQPYLFAKVKEYIRDKF